MAKYKEIAELWAERPALTGYHVLVLYRSRETKVIKQATAHPSLSLARAYAEAFRHIYDVAWVPMLDGIPELPVVINLIPPPMGDNAGEVDAGAA